MTSERDRRGHIMELGRAAQSIYMAYLRSDQRSRAENSLYSVHVGPHTTCSHRKLHDASGRSATHKRINCDTQPWNNDLLHSRSGGMGWKGRSYFIFLHTQSEETA
jgi:hypothetical protein